MHSNKRAKELRTAAFQEASEADHIPAITAVDRHLGTDDYTYISDVQAGHQDGNELRRLVHIYGLANVAALLQTMQEEVN